MTRFLALALCLALCLALVGCATSSPVTPPAPSTSLQVVANALLTTAQTIGDLQAAAINANAQGLLSDAATRTILTITSKLAMAGKQADAITAGIAALGPIQKSTLFSIFDPILKSVNDSLGSGLIPAGANTNTIRLLLTAIQGTLSGVEVALAGAN